MTSMKQTRATAQWSKKIAIGGRKEESLEPSVSLQDVFSDSANLTGMQQKTSCPSEIGQGKWVATPKKEKKKPSNIHGFGRIWININ